ncbi:hypothetical protein [Lewinella cohaerens]|uniref:hypothetical protein n=1 Tax=Lewinella cohaerens TaxID=70995 RepID=UPI00036C5E73|nr:hypothetical protein [Lewinella cohaerens]
MNFNKRLESLKAELLEATYFPKNLMLKCVSNLLEKNVTHLEGEIPVLWIEAMNTSDLQEIPTTKYGVSEVRVLLQSLEPTRNNIQKIIPRVVELLITFLVEDDLCDRQGQFYYYFDQHSGQVFAESEMGIVRPPIIGIRSSNVRPAYISELIRERILVDTEDDRLC